MARLIDSMKNKALHIVLSRASNPVAISRHATWLREETRDFRAASQPPLPVSKLAKTASGAGRMRSDPDGSEAGCVRNPIRRVLYRLAAKAAVAGASIVVFLNTAASLCRHAA